LDFYGLDPGKKTLVVIGGSLGAKAINEALAVHLDAILESGCQVIWQTGSLYYDRFREQGERKGVQVFEYIESMDLLYAASDVLVSRAGAGTISELCIVGKPVIFIPSPNVAEDHQTKNAPSVVKDQAAWMLEEKDMESFSTLVLSLLSDEKEQEKLSRNIRKLALPDATSRIADEVEKLMKN
jgi:UDP-N-acetylglucosamine--N-acetylmuramyl-(pentapeptide) pyrophosphoryl-undecaprenol N-acetylglucosamine transferase